MSTQKVGTQKVRTGEAHASEAHEREAHEREVRERETLTSDARLHLRALHLQCFRGFRAPTELGLGAGLNVIVGDNGSGKSSLCNAIEWCLFGRTVESKGSGITEYKDREIRHRGSDDADTRVALVFGGPEGDVHVSRSRAADAKANRPEDHLEVRDASGRHHSGEDAQRWLAAQGFPTWATWRSAYCQHQEDARHRLLDASSLRASLAALLGLDELVALRGRFDGLKRHRHVKAVKRVEAQQQEELLELATAPGPLDEAAAACERLGVDPRGVTQQTTRQAAEGLCAAARELAQELDLNAPVGDAEQGVDAVLAWAAAWPAAVRSQPGKVTHLTGLRQPAGVLQARIHEVEPLSAQVTRDEEGLRSALARGGDSDERARALAQAREAAAQASAARKAASELRALLQDATQVLEGAAEETCPVCESAVKGLPARLEARLAQLSSQDAIAMDEACAQTSAALRAAEAEAAALTRLEASLSGSRERLEGATRTLREQLPPDRAEADDPLAAARATLESYQTELAGLEPLLQARDASLETHRRDTERLVARARYLEVLTHQTSRVEVTTGAAWETYQEALDGLVSDLVDCEALASISNELLGHHSAEQLSVVNRTLGQHFAQIIGDPQAAARGLTIQAHITATQVAYLVQDGRGEPLLPILNQASLNAIALAVLFAQAAERTDRGGPALLVLDDPEQSLDADHLAGLARVLETMTASTPVILAVPPGALADRIRDYAGCPKQFIHLEPWRTDTGARIRPSTAPSDDA